MAIKAIVFDLDGVLVETKTIHYEALNQAISDYDPRFIINYTDHLNRYDGLSTKLKLSMLVKEGLNSSFVDKIYLNKKKYTEEKLHNTLSFNQSIYDIFFKLKAEKLLIAIATNAIRQTLDNVTKTLKLNSFIDFKISNDDLVNPKPHSEIYLKTFLSLAVNPNETIIIEDSKLGREAAYNSGGHCLEIEDFKHDLTFDYIQDKIMKINSNKNTIKWKSNNLNILIPMAGHGSRFQEKGYVFPKPLISIKNKPMIQTVIDNLAIDAKYNFITLKEHNDKYNIKNVLSLCVDSGCNIIEIDQVTEGAACTSLLAEEHINNDKALIIANSDQFIEWDSSEVMYSIVSSGVDGAILTFKSTHPKWSYAKINSDNFVTEVAEKNPISDNATVGIYYWKKGSDYVKYAKQMIKKNIRVNNEFYICPVYNEAIKDNKKIVIKEVKEMWGLGTPEDLEEFLKFKAHI